MSFMTDIFSVPSPARICSPLLPSSMDSLKASIADFFNSSFQFGECKRVVALTPSGDEADASWLPGGHVKHHHRLDFMFDKSFPFFVQKREPRRVQVRVDLDKRKKPLGQVYICEMFSIDSKILTVYEIQQASYLN